MNKNILTFVTALLVGGSLLLTSCKKDETAPVITLKGDSVQVVNLTEAADPGATANDEKDGEITVISSDYATAVNKNQVGTYTVKYTASDEATNEATKNRTVKVKGDFLAGSYSATDVVTGSTSGSGTYTYNVTATASADTYNKLTINNFGGFSGATVYCTVVGTVVTIPSQNFTGGGIPSGSTISGSGTYDGAAKKFLTMNYSGNNDIGNGNITLIKQ